MRFVTLVLPTVALAAPLASVSDPRPTAEQYAATKKAEQEAADAKSAKSGKMAAINKVVELLTTLKSDVLAEGEREAKSYETFACFCKDTTTEKAAAIQKGEDDKDALATEIEALVTKREDLDDKIEDSEKTIEQKETSMKTADKSRKVTAKIYGAEEKDFSDAIAAIEGALQVLKSSKPSLVQMQAAARNIQQVADFAEALGMVSGAAAQRTASVLLQADPDVPMENYKFKSNAVIDMLEALHKDVRGQKEISDKAEVASISEYDIKMNDFRFEIKLQNELMDKNKQRRKDTIAEIASTSELLTTTTANLIEDQEYMMEMSTICQNKAKTWDQRIQTRADELSALTSAIAIIKGTVSDKTSGASLRFAQRGVSVRLAMAMTPDTLENIEESAEALDAKSSHPLNFLQKVSKHEPAAFDARHTIAALLGKDGTHLKSTLLTALASRIGNDPLAKVKTLIGELITRLQAEEASEAEQKGFCDKHQGEENEKKTRAAESIREVNMRLEKGEVRTEKLNAEIITLETEINELETSKTRAIAARANETSENAATVNEAEEGLAALNSAIQFLTDFYDQERTVDLTLTQTKGPEDDMPDAGFDEGEAYNGAGDKAGGVLGMLDVIKSDFERTIKLTKQDEAEADQDHKAFVEETDIALKKKGEAKTEKESQENDLSDEMTDDHTTLDSQTGLLTAAIASLIELKAACVDTGMSYAERVERREDEIRSLKNALCIFNKFPDHQGQCGLYEE